MLRSLLALFVLAFWVLAAQGCGRTRPFAAEEPTLAVINGEALTRGEFDRYVEVKLGDVAREPLNDTVRSELFDELVVRKVTVQAARAQGLAAIEGLSSATAASAARTEDSADLLIQEYYRERVLKGVDVSPDEVSRFYAAHRSDYECDGGYYVREICADSREKVEEARRDIESGKASFADVARSVSRTPTAANGGLAYYDANVLPPQLERAIAPLRKGQLSGVVHSAFGYHLFKLERRGGAESLEHVRDKIVSDLRATKNQRLVEADAERLLDGAKVQINRDQLQFQYEGRFEKK
jgi:hypothetical protein